MSVLFDKMAVCSEATERFLKAHTDLFYRKEEFEEHKEYVADIFDSFCYSLYAGGKRLRPFLVLEFCELCGKNHTDALSYAASLEMIHTFSLIHDDLPCMDNDDMRRGKPTNHKLYGEACALLAGDALAIDAFSVICDNDFSAEQNIMAVKLLSANAGVCGMIAGQQIDMYSEEKNVKDETLLKLLQNKKTGALFECACLLGCIAAGKYKGSTEYECAKKYAEHIGLAFQITDDILDVCGDSEILGKNVGSDEQKNKTTFVSLLGVEGAKKKAREILDKAKDALCGIQGDKSALYELCDYIYSRNK